ncbi:hypothetical protein [Microbispora sp. CA-102843]|uniref:hypothetical protein n=1 Tax=Microbispora sp. CA-102843 TaxID=3239952 RepID=UPI003D9209C1
MAQPTPAEDQAPSPDGALLTRLWRRVEQPGCVRHGQVRALLARHRRMAGEPPLAELLLRRGHGTDIEPSGPPIVVARPATAAPGAVPGVATPPAAPQPSVRTRPARPNDQPSSLPSPARRAAQAPADPAGLVSPLPSATSTPAPTTATGTLTPRAGARPAAGAARPGAPRPVLSAPARPVPGLAAMPPGTGPDPWAPSAATVGETRRPVVRAGGDSKAPPTLAWPRPSPEQAGGTSGPARPPVPVVRERVSPQGAWRPGPAVPQRPAMPQRPAPPAADPTVPAPGRTADPARAARVPSRTSPDKPVEPVEPSGHRAGQREPARPTPPQIDLNRIVSTVQRRLTHQMAIERERRGMRR